MVNALAPPHPLRLTNIDFATRRVGYALALRAIVTPAQTRSLDKHRRQNRNRVLLELLLTESSVTVAKARLQQPRHRIGGMKQPVVLSLNLLRYASASASTAG